MGTKSLEELHASCDEMVEQLDTPAARHGDDPLFAAIPAQLRSRVTWFDPRSGAYTVVGDIAKDGTSNEHLATVKPTTDATVKPTTDATVKPTTDATVKPTTAKGDEPRPT